MSPIAVACLSLLAMLGLIWAGMHVAVVLALVSFVGVWLIRGDMDVAANLLAQASQDAVASHIFGVVPLFVLTGFLVARADVGKDAFEVANQVLRRVRGGWAWPPWRRTRCLPPSPASRSPRPRCSRAWRCPRCCASATSRALPSGWWPARRCWAC